MVEDKEQADEGTDDKMADTTMTQNQTDMKPEKNVSNAEAGAAAGTGAGHQVKKAKPVIRSVPLVVTSGLEERDDGGKVRKYSQFCTRVRHMTRDRLKPSYVGVLKEGEESRWRLGEASGLNNSNPNHCQWILSRRCLTFARSNQ